MLGELLSADPGYRGPRVSCGNGHHAGFTGYRDKVIDTALGPVTLRRAWYHCAACGHGLAPRDAELGVAGASLSPGLAAMNDLASAAVPFRQAARLLEELAGVRLDARRAQRAAEADGPPSPPRPASGPASSPGGSSSRSRQTRCRTSSTWSSTAPASP